MIEHTGSITSIITPGPTTASGGMSPVGSGRQFELPTGTALLVVLRGPGEGTEYVLRPAAGVVSIGRTPDAGIFLDDVTVSRHHAELRHGAEGWSVRDAGSLNGTYCNRVRVEDQQLQGGDELQIGKFRFVFLLGLDDPA
jgi:pSer/pThr/pTyr-binding forkhead associated (FHA) protein